MIDVYLVFFSVLNNELFMIQLRQKIRLGTVANLGRIITPLLSGGRLAAAELCVASFIWLRNSRHITNHRYLTQFTDISHSKQCLTSCFKSHAGFELK